MMFPRLVPMLAAALSAGGLAVSANAAPSTVNCTDGTGANPGGTCTLWDTNIAAGTTATWCDGTALGGGTNDTIILANPIFVEGVLRILPGCIVRGQVRTAAPASPPVGAPGTLVVARDGYLDAQATADDPIIFTTAAPDIDAFPNRADDADFNRANGLTAWTDGDAFLDDTPVTNPLAPLDAAGVQNVGLWGGIVILGHAPTNLGDDGDGLPYGEKFAEGLDTIGPAAYGGTEPHDCSGIMRYWSIRHAGDEVTPNNELNGVALGGVGDCTVFENIEVYTNLDDGIENWGGTLNMKNLVMAYVGDDSLDLDEGYEGSVQNVFTVSAFFNQDDGSDYGSGGSGESMGEWDGDNCAGDCNLRADPTNAAADINSWPTGAPAVYNMTGIGNQPDGGTVNPAVSPAAANKGFEMVNNFSGIVANSIVANLGGVGCIERPTPVNAPDQVHVISTTCSDTAAPAGASAPIAFTRGDAAVAAGEYEGGSANYCVGGSCAGGAPASAPILTNEDIFFEPKCAATGNKLVGCKAATSSSGAPIDPRPDAGAVPAEVGGGIAPNGPGLDRSATYRGAFPAGAPLWTDGWTAMDAGDLL